MKNERIYRIWKAMRTRCNNKRFINYKYYGGKGVKVCKEWDEYKTFEEWAINNGYSDNLTIDRINGDGDYEPTNCRWITIEEQQSNRSWCITEVVEGEEMTLQQISEKYNIPENTLRSRRNVGKNGEDLISPVRKAKTFNIYGETLTMKQMAETYNIPWSTIRARYSRGLRGINLLGDANGN